MDKPAPKESKSSFKAQLRLWGMPEVHYKILETIFRQSLMSHAKSGYKYSHDFIDKDLYGNQSPEKRLKNLLLYVGLWEKKTTLEFGFEEVHINEIEKANRIIDEYKIAKTKLNELVNQVGLILDDDTSDQWLAKLQDKVKKSVAVNAREPGRFLIFDSKGVPLKAENKHEYFTRYIGFHYGVFFDYFDKISTARNQRTALYRFISTKIRREHRGVETIDGFTPAAVQERIHNNKNIENYYEIPRALKLIDDPFTKFLVKQAIASSKTAA